MEGLLPEVQCQIIADFYGKNVSKGKMYNSSILRRWDAKKKDAKYRVMRLIDAGEAVPQEEGQGKPRKLTKSQEKRVTY